MPIIEATKGAYTVEYLHELPFYQVLQIWESVIYISIERWLQMEPDSYDIPLTAETLKALKEED